MNGWMIAGIVLLVIVISLYICGTSTIHYRELEINNRFWRALVSGALLVVEIFLSLM
ncbi:hypothetical protein [Enterococcus pallens]|uniref:Uncharacterized protein n=1 Tax=Enterococcus pallens ATCC BAA-351 TaxID=1158607 RepID=R2SHQ8_9ENTE|nr:hypothetical protein [Enterococcus pallens]EOH87724.1 hypothetical protein UAU_04578 [Enterococcus pallens ATCC BAA-351]EOU17938.1 hypothetical protein I588_02926 [Enterococcus pallens ATCC BAA-351]OJG82439.1 hypothetical protein RV10_GL000260 [Enterococcus pallens]